MGRGSQSVRSAPGGGGGGTISFFSYVIYGCAPIPFICTVCVYTRESVHSFAFSSPSTCIYPYVSAFAWLPVRPFTCPFVHLCLLPSIHLYVCNDLSVCLSVGQRVTVYIQLMHQY